VDNQKLIAIHPPPPICWLPLSCPLITLSISSISRRKEEKKAMDSLPETQKEQRGQRTHAADL